MSGPLHLESRPAARRAREDGYSKDFKDQLSSTKNEQPGLREMLDYLRPGQEAPCGLRARLPGQLITSMAGV